MLIAEFPSWLEIDCRSAVREGFIRVFEGVSWESQFQSHRRELVTQKTTGDIERVAVAMFQKGGNVVYILVVPEGWDAEAKDGGRCVRYFMREFRWEPEGG